MALPAHSGGIRGFLPPAPEPEMRKIHARDAVLTDYAHTLIPFKARQLSRRSGFTRSDEEDLEQDLWTALLSQAELFDPDRASIDTFIDRVVNSAVMMILRDRRRQKRANGFQAQSLSNPVYRCGPSTEPVDAELTAEDRCRYRGAFPVDESQLTADREAAQHALSEMPSELRDVCRRVMGGSISSAARELGRSRRQIRNVLAEARAYFERAGLGDL